MEYTANNIVCKKVGDSSYISSDRGGSHMKKYTLMSIENDHRITKNTDREFLCAIQTAMLAALVEAGQMSEMQYRYAEKRLHA